MANYSYRAKSATGQLVSGKIEADSPRGAATKLREKSLVPLSIQEYVEAGDVMASVSAAKKLPLKTLTMFCNQFSVMVNAGLALLPALSILQKQAANKNFQGVLADLRKSLESGDSLSRAMAKHPKAFPPIMIYMVEAGEAGGVLDKVLVRVAEHFEKESKTVQKVKSAMTYPIIVLVIALGITSALIMFVLPMFSEMFEGTGVELPGITVFLLNLSTFLKKYFLFLIAGIAAAIGAFALYARTADGRRNKDALMLKLPLFGPLTMKMVVSRFTRTFSTLLSSGVPMLQCLEIVGKIADNVIIEGKLKAVGEQVKSGAPLGVSLEKSGIFPPMVVQMTMIGEETGSVDALMTKVADFYDDEVDAAVKGLTQAIEPIMTIFLAGIVCMILLSVFLPMAKMMQVMG